MRQSSLSFLPLAAILMISSSGLAQHHDAGAAPSAPPPSPPPSVAPAAPAPAPSHTPSFTPSAPSVSTAHTSTPSVPSAPSMPENHAAPAPHPAPTPSERISPTPKASGEEKIAPAPRIGENESKEKEAKPSEPDHRRKVCDGGPCKEPPQPEPPRADLRRHPCPPGQTEGKNGCESANNPTTFCEAGSIWNGAACAPAGTHCPPGQISNGAACLQDCTTFNARAASIQHSIWVSRTERDEACRNDSTSAACLHAQAAYDFEVSRYRTLQNEAGPGCSAGLGADPTSF